MVSKENAEHIPYFSFIPFKTKHLIIGVYASIEQGKRLSVRRLLGYTRHKTYQFAAAYILQMESTGVNSSVYVLTRILELYRSDSKLYTICNFKQNLLVSVNWKFLGKTSFWNT